MQSRVSNNGEAVHYLLGGREGSPVLVLLHGLGMSPSVYSDLGDLLSQQFLVVVPDYSGLGKVNFAAIAAKLTELPEVRGREIVLIAHSMGGGVAIYWARFFEAQISRVILVGSAGEPVTRSLKGWGVAALYKAARSWKHPIRVVQIAGSFSRNWLKHPLWMWKAFRLTTTCDLLEELKAIKVETNLVWADGDEYFPSCERMAAVLGVEPVVVPNAGHDWIILEPKAAAKEIERLLAASTFTTR